MKTKIQFEHSVFFSAAMSILFVPLKWVGAAFTAGVIHEFGHIAAVYFCRRRILSVCIRPFGTRIETEPMDSWQEIICILAGPVASLLLVCLSSVFPRIALCALFQGIFNLLPIYPLDGGRIVQKIPCKEQR